MIIYDIEEHEEKIRLKVESSEVNCVIDPNNFSSIPLEFLRFHALMAGYIIAFSLTLSSLMYFG